MMVPGRGVAAISWICFMGGGGSAFFPQSLRCPLSTRASHLLHRGLSSVYTRACLLHTGLSSSNTRPVLYQHAACALPTRGHVSYQHAVLASINTRACPLSTCGPVFYQYADQHAGPSSINTRAFRQSTRGSLLH